jgi:tetratricopeptide (TPR) repeat protein
MNPRTRHKLDEASAALADQRHDEALSLVQQVLRAHPGDLEARLIEARIQLARRRPRASLDALNALELHDDARRGRPDVAMLRLDALAAAGEYSLALKLASRLADRFPDDDRAHRAKAHAALQLNHVDEAADALREVVRLCPNDRAASDTLASLVAAHRPDEAIDLLQRHRDPLQRRQVARWMVRAGRWRDARELYRELLRDQPDDEVLCDEAGRLADACGDDDEAMHLLRDTAALAEAHMHAGRLAEAGRCWWRLVRRAHADVRAWTGLLICAVETGHERAARFAARHLDVHASRHERQHAMAGLWPHAACGLAVARAMRATDEHAISPPSPLQTMLRKATATLDRQTRRHPRRADAHYHLAVCRAALHESGAAERAVSEALRLNPNYAAASHLAVRLAQRQAA